MSMKSSNHSLHSRMEFPLSHKTCLILAGMLAHVVAGAPDWHGPLQPHDPGE
jgi:hypothetical protein